MATGNEQGTQAKERPRVIWLQNAADHYFVQMLQSAGLICRAESSECQRRAAILPPNPFGESAMPSPRRIF